MTGSQSRKGWKGAIAPLESVTYQTASRLLREDFLGSWAVTIRLTRGGSGTPRKLSGRDGKGDKLQRPRSPNS